MKIKPLADRVVLKSVEIEEKSAGGIILAASAQEKPQMATVIAVGPGGVIDGKEVAMYVKEGQQVIYSKYAGTEVTSVTLGKNITYINENAFKFSDKLKTITINSKLLKSGSVEYGAFDKVPDSCVITVPKKKLKGYKKIFKAAGLSSKVKIKGK